MAVTLNAPVKNAALRAAAQELVNAPNVDAKSVGKLVASFASSQAGAALDNMKKGLLPPDLMLPIARKSLDASNAADLKALLDDKAFTAKLDPTSLNFLKAVVGLEPLRTGGVFGGAAVQSTPELTNKQAAAVATMREWVSQGRMREVYEAAIGQKHDPELHAKALAVFDSLPKIGPGVSADDLVKAGYWKAVPRGLKLLDTMPRYSVGREVKVRTHVHADVKNVDRYMSYDPNGPMGITSRAKIVGESGDHFQVQVEGAPHPIDVKKQEIFDLNQPTKTPTKAHYDDPFTKAKMAEVALAMADDVAKLDFGKKTSAAQGGALAVRFGVNAVTEDMVAIQKRCVEKVFKAIDMKFPQGTIGDTANGRVAAVATSPGRVAIKGVGIDVDQNRVMRDLLQPLSDLLGVDIRTVTGGIARHADKNASQADQLRSISALAHEWLEVTYRPSQETVVVDPCWRQVNFETSKAYGVYGDRYPVTASWEATAVPVKATDVG